MKTTLLGLFLLALLALVMLGGFRWVTSDAADAHAWRASERAEQRGLLDRPTSDRASAREFVKREGEKASSEDATFEAGAFEYGRDVVSALEELEPAMIPTADGLLARTAELWSQDGFAQLTAAEVRELLPVDDDLQPSPANLAELLGGLPTRADCELALRDDAVRSLLEATCAAELLSYQAQFGRDQRAIASTRASFKTTERALMAELDRAGPYRSWRLLHRAFAAWSGWDDEHAPQSAARTTEETQKPGEPR